MIRISVVRKRYILAGFLFLAFLSASPLYAQYTASQAITQRVTGKITDATNDLPLQGASIIFLPGKSGGATDTEGKFSLPVPKGATAMVVTFTGYAEDTIAIPSDTAALAIRLSSLTAKALDEVRVRYQRKSTEVSLMGAIKTEKIGANELLRAACCNLSESFETTPSVDIGYTDAVSGYKQIEMLGLAGSNTFYTRENIPENRGLASITGLTFTPGTWLEGIQLSKGSGSVVNGYEGVAGQINTEWIKPFELNEPRLILNGYQSVQGRSEGNLVFNHAFDKNLSTNLLLYGRSDWRRNDENKDGFMDNPLGDLFVASNRWFYFGPTGWEFQGGLKGVYLDATGGEMDFHKNGHNDNSWGYQNRIKRIEGWAKIGKVYPDKPYKSMGLQLTGVYHQQNSRFGERHYDATQHSFYANYIYQSIISNTNNVIKAGASVQADYYDENFAAAQFDREEIVPGVFLEYSYSYLTKLNVVAGLRADHNNLFGSFVTPRLHIRYAPFENTSVRASIGRAQRTANILAENTGLMASNRLFEINDVPLNNFDNKNYPFRPEVAWNTGVNVTQKFRLNYRDGSFTADYYYTDFRNQVITDFEQPGLVNFYNLEGKSYAHSFQAQLDYEAVRNFNVRFAYRYYDVKTAYNDGLKEKPLVAHDRAFANLNYKAAHNWTFNYTVQWTGTKRLPGTLSYAEKRSPSFVQMNAQVNKSFLPEKLELYAGVENLTNYMQHPLILGADNTAGAGFDASQVWGPVMGRNIYIGFKWQW